jgi:hypothetical protein
MNTSKFKYMLAELVNNKKTFEASLKVPYPANTCKY